MGIRRTIAFTLVACSVILQLISLYREMSLRFKLFC